MVTVAHLVERIVEQKPFVQEALSRGIINNAALAEELIPLLEKELRKKVKFSAVNMAIRRLAEKLEKSKVIRPKFDKNSDITVKSDLIAFTIFKVDELQGYIKKLYDIVDFKSGDFLTITQGLHEVMIITNKKYEKDVLKLFKKKVKKVIQNISSLTINIPLSAVDTVGLFYSATRALAWENINLTDIVSTYTEMTFLINEKETGRAFDVLKGLVEANS